MLMPLSRKLLLLITPSWLSLSCGIILAFVFAGLTSLSLADHSGRLGGVRLSAYLQSTSLSNTGSLIGSFLSDIRFTSVFFVIFWIIIGFIAYNIIFVLKGSVDESVGFIQELHYINAKSTSMRVRVIVRFLLLVAAIILWIIFALVFSWVLLPDMLSLINTSVTGGSSPINVIYSFLIFLATTHVAVIILRFTLLRARLSHEGN